MSNPATFDQAYQMLNLAREANVSLEALQSLYATGLLSDLLKAENPVAVDREAFRKLLGLDPLQLRITVDYRMSLQQMILAGHYDWVNDGITLERFPIVGDGVVECETKLFHFNRRISSEVADEEIRTADKRSPWESAKIEHLLAFGATFLEMQRKFPIVGLASSCEVRGGRGVPDLWGGDSGRSLSLDWWDGDWYGGFRFLAVRKQSSGS